MRDDIMNEKNMIAYNSKIFPFLFLIMTVIVCIVGYFAVKELYDYKVLAILFFVITAAALLFAFIWTFTNKQIAFEIKNDEFTIYKHKKVFKINMHNINKVKIGTQNIGFDCVVYYEDTKKIGIHFLVKKFRHTNKEFIRIIDAYNIKKEFYSLG